MNTLDSDLESLRDGRMPSGRFYANTHALWERIARSLLRRWSAPKWVTIEDLAQELRLGAWDAVWRYEPAYAAGGTIGRFVIWNAIDHAKKKLHKMRGAKLSGDADRNPSRFETPLSTMSATATTEWLEGLLTVGPTQHALYEQHEAEERAQRVCINDVERSALRAFAETEDLVQAAVMLYSDEESRKALGFETAGDAGRAVANAAYAVARRLENAAA